MKVIERVGRRRRRGTRAGFALILIVALLALLVLAVYGLSVLVRVDSQLVATSSQQVRARQNALLGLQVALGELQRTAGRDDRVTAMGGMAGEEGGSQRRHWCGVWDDGGAFLGWLVSGASAGAAPSLSAADSIQLVGQSSVGAKPATASVYVDEEYVDAGKVALSARGWSGDDVVSGSFAYWVGDEGVKISALTPSAELPAGGSRIQIFSTLASLTRIEAAFQQADVGNAPKVLAYEQATNLFYSGSSRLTLASLRYGFHHVTRLHRSIASDGGETVGRVNLNTTSAVVWRSLVESYELLPGAIPFGTVAQRASAIAAIADGMAGSASGKVAGAPFVSVGAFLGSSLLSDAIASDEDAAVVQFRAAMEPILAVRSDTFRIRAYGEARNPVHGTTEALAYCEAMVQRTSETIDATFGRRFVVTYFRWLGPDDI